MKPDSLRLGGVGGADELVLSLLDGDLEADELDLSLC